MKPKLQIAFIGWRFYFVIILFLIVVAGLLFRMFYLTVFDQHFLRNQGDARVVRVVSAPAFRGMITDRNGYPLAISTSVYSVWANPKEFNFQDDTLNNLSKTLTTDPQVLKKLIQKYKAKGKEFVYLKRDVSPEVAKLIKTYHYAGVYLQQEYKRYYPEGEVAAHIVGFTNVDDQGQEGLELAYNDWLAGKPGKKVVIKDRLGRIISETHTLQQQKPGNDVRLSVNRRIQYLAYRELLQGVQKNIAASGSVVVLDIQTGEILAMVNLPSYNPNIRAKDTKNLRNRAVTDTFEPGSTIKAFSIATALDSGLYKPDTIINTFPGWLRVGGHLVKDEHTKGPLTVTQVLQLSSNVGVTKMILSLPPDHLWNLLHRVGFGEETGIGFPGEQFGKLIHRKTWKPFALATLAFGYGISVTPLQLAHAYATLANGGVKVPLSLLRVDKVPDGEQVIDPKLSREMLTLLQSVVARGGTGELAKIPGYQVAGKTGTAIMAGPHGYEQHHYISSFVGIAPVTKPRIVVAVVIQDPQGKQYYGGMVSGPVFRNIMEATLHLLNITPDDPDSLLANKKTMVVENGVEDGESLKEDSGNLRTLDPV